jgi:iron complex transport system permease protein
LAKIQFWPALLALNVGVVVGLIILTLLLGRVYCSVICPLGVLQDIISWFASKRKKYRFSYSPALKWVRYGTLVIFILACIAGIGSLVALISWMLLKASEYDVSSALRWLSGSLNGVSMDQVPRLMVVVVFSTVAIFLLNRHLEILQLGEAHARVLGIRITATRLGLILCALLLIAFATSVTGPIASVAFLAGPIAARISGSGKSNLMTSALTGCVLVMVSDLVGQYAFPSRYPVGVVTGILGAPYLIYLLIRMNRMEG